MEQAPGPADGAARGTGKDEPVSWGKPKVKKYEAGSRIDDIHDLIDTLNAGSWIIVRGKPMHPTVLSNWSFASLQGLARGGQAFVANVTEAWEHEQKVESGEIPF
jgi:hypothetical protein